MNNKLQHTCARLVFSAVSLLLAASTCPFRAQGEDAFIFGSVAPHQGEIIIDGTSTLHDWQVKGNTIRGRLKVFPGADGLSGSASAISKFPAGVVKVSDASAAARITVPVRSLTGGNKRMDREMFRTLDAEKHDEILFVLTKIERLSDSYEETSESYQGQYSRVMAGGDLTISGQTREVAFPVTIALRNNGLRITGAAELKMTDFGLTPPRAFMGLLRTADRIKVAFDWSPERLPE